MSLLDGDNYVMITANQASTYTQITHFNKTDPLKTNPRDVGVKFVPFPLASIMPQRIRYSGDHLLSCPACHAYINKFDTITKDGYICALCGLKIRRTTMDHNGIEFNNEVYEAYLSSKNIVRAQFIPTDFYLISLSILKDHPTFLSVIANSYNHYQGSKQIGIAFIHGGMSILQFHPHLQLLTFPDEIPTLIPAQYFAIFSEFHKVIAKLETFADSAPINEKKISSYRAIKFALELSSSFGTNLRIFLDETDFHNTADLPDLRVEALRALDYGTQVSLGVFADEICYQNPLLDLPIVTGGFLHHFPIRIESQALQAQMSPLLRPYLYHDTEILAYGPNRSEIVDFAGQGLLTSSHNVTSPKIQPGDTFYFTFSGSHFRQSVFQFVVFYSTGVSRNMRVITFDASSAPPISIDVMGAWIGAMIAHRILTEGQKSAEKKLRELKKQFAGLDIDSEFRQAEGLLQISSFMDRVESALIMRSGLKMSNPSEGVPTFSAPAPLTEDDLNL